MRKILFILLVATFSGCSSDDSQEPNDNSNGLSGNHFNLTITNKPQFMSYQVAVELNGTPTLNHYQHYMAIDSDTDVRLYINDNVDADLWEFHVNVFQYQQYPTVDQQRIIYLLKGNVPLEMGDQIDFTIGEHGIVDKFYIRHYNGTPALIKNIELNTTRL